MPRPTLRRFRFAALCVCALLLADAARAGESAAVCRFGDDEIPVPPDYVLPGEEERTRLREHFDSVENATRFLDKKTGKRAERPKTDAVDGIDYGVDILEEKTAPVAAGLWRRRLPGSTDEPPLRRDATVAEAGSGVCVRDDDTIAWLTWENLGYFCRPPKTADEFRDMVALLHGGVASMRMLDAPTTERLLEAAASDDAPGFEVAGRAPEAELLARGPHREDGYWRWNFILVETGVNVVEYKYVLDARNRVGFLRRALVQGAPKPRLDGDVMFFELPDEVRDAYRKHTDQRAFVTDVVDPPAAGKDAAPRK